MAATIKTVQLPVKEWTILKALAVNENRTIASYLRNLIYAQAKKNSIAITDIKG
jgi:hypothetical protein